MYIIISCGSVYFTPHESSDIIHMLMRISFVAIANNNGVVSNDLPFISLVINVGVQHDAGNIIFAYEI